LIDPALILIALHSLPSAYEQGDLQAVADAIADVAKTRTEAAVLVALGWHETKFVKLAMEGHCDQLPKGMRCDNGKALGPWQLHQQACPAAWQLATPNGGPEGQVESLRVQAACAIRLLRYFGEKGREHTPTPTHAAFAGYAAHGWAWPGAEVRVQTVRRVLEHWPRKGGAR